MKRLLAFGLIVYAFVIINTNIAQMPEKIPTHFNRAGKPTDYGSPQTLWMLLAVQAGGTLLMLAIPALGRRWPQLVNLGTRRLSDFTKEQQKRIMPLLVEMSDSMGLLFSFLFAALIRDIVGIARAPGTPPQSWPMAVFFVGMGLVIVYYLWRIHQVAKQAPAGSQSLDD